MQQQRTVPRVCERCGGAFLAAAGEVRRGGARFCGKACQRLFLTYGTAPRPDPLAHFWSKVDLSGGPEACWPWWAAVKANGYGAYTPLAPAVPDGTPRLVYAHRWAWQLVHGRIPGGLVIDHRCFNPRCCNPGHLQLVTSRDNVLRGRGATMVAHREGRCVHGHELTAENTLWTWSSEKGRVTARCRLCARAAGARVRAKRRRPPDPLGGLPPSPA
jgi:hypothetical protein